MAGRLKYLLPALAALLLLAWLATRRRETTEIPWSIRLFEPDVTPEWHPQDGTAVPRWAWYGGNWIQVMREGEAL